MIAVSSGNHGMAVAFSARAFGKKCTSCDLPENPVQEKADAIAEYGAQVLKFGKYHNEREEKARQMVQETGVAFIHPFNDPAIIVGQGTCGLEIAEQLAEGYRLGDSAGRRRGPDLGHRIPRSRPRARRRRSSGSSRSRRPS